TQVIANAQEQLGPAVEIAETAGLERGVGAESALDLFVSPPALGAHLIELTKSGLRISAPLFARPLEAELQILDARVDDQLGNAAEARQRPGRQLPSRLRPNAELELEPKRIGDQVAVEVGPLVEPLLRIPAVVASSLGEAQEQRQAHPRRQPL